MNTGQGWSTWNPGGTFVTRYIRESAAHHVTPVFSYYMVRQSLPGSGVGNELQADIGNLDNPGTMRALLADLKLFFQRAGATRRRVVLHVEPDLWGYVEQASRGDNASTVPALVSAAGMPQLKGLPDTAAGFAQAVKRLRDRYAPRVLLAYHLSVWGTKVDIALQNPPNAQVKRLGHRAAAFYRSLHTHFDLTFAEFSDRDSGFKQKIYGDGGASWWNAADFARDVRFLSTYSRAAHQRIVMWQIPLGNREMRAENNTWGHFQDNRVEWLLGRHSARHLAAYRRAGVIAFLFGGGADGTTCACDAQHDGVTNPPPIDGNNRRSLSADDDGGLFRQLARRFYSRSRARLLAPRRLRQQ
ncbi:MAG TPA: hypothetical protein VJU60_07000 [Thermoleophilaceae bacterium]|nr:hypothetical protein [Thermoleophilaceae bacterium]